MSNVTITPENWTEYKGQNVTAQHVDGTTIITGTLISLNTKGWNFNVDGKTVTRTENVIADVSTGNVEGIEDIADELDAEYAPENDLADSDETDDEVDTVDNDEDFVEGDSTRDIERRQDDEDDDDLEEVADDSESTEAETVGHSTADLAALFNTNARALRIRLRKMGLGVGKGKTYAFSDEEMSELKATFTKEPVEA